MGTSDNHFCTLYINCSSIPFASIHLHCVWYHKMFIHDKSIFSTTTNPELTVRQRSYCNCIPLQTNSASFRDFFTKFLFHTFLLPFGFRAVRFPKDMSAKTSVVLEFTSRIFHTSCAAPAHLIQWRCVHCVGRTMGVSEDGVRLSIFRSGSNSRKAQAIKLMNACALVISINSSGKGPFCPAGSGPKLGLYALWPILIVALRYHIAVNDLVLCYSC